MVTSLGGPAEREASASACCPGGYASHVTQNILHVVESQTLHFSNRGLSVGLSEAHMRFSILCQTAWRSMHRGGCQTGAETRAIQGMQPREVTNAAALVHLKT
eukprot:4165724-Amphidinium_carterae.1